MLYRGGENHRPVVSHRQTLSHNVIYSHFGIKPVIWGERVYV